jgi:hypothetical protein
MVLRAESARHMLAAGVHPDDIICENVIKMGAVAQNSISNGISTMLANLGSSLSVDTCEDSNEGATPLLAVIGKDKSLGADILAAEVFEDGIPECSWIKEYYAGAGKEMYLIHLSKVRWWPCSCKDTGCVANLCGSALCFMMTEIRRVDICPSGFKGLPGDFRNRAAYRSGGDVFG